MYIHKQEIIFQIACITFFMYKSSLKKRKIEKDPYKDTLIQAGTKSGLDWTGSTNRRLGVRVCMRVDPI